MSTVSEGPTSTESATATGEKVGWKNDGDCPTCAKCGAKFSLFRRRHHCRSCGGVFCSDCCSDKVVGLPGYSQSAERICVVCKGAASAPSSRPRDRKICILGHGCVGKTAIFQQFFDRTFSPDYRSSITQSRAKILRFRGSEYNLTVMDTAGQSGCDLFQPQYTIGTHAFMLVYSVDDRSSFDVVRILYERVLDCGAHDAAMVLVANKCDLKDQRQVPQEEAAATAKKWGAQFVEISAKNAKHVDDLFNLVMKEIVARESS